MSKGNIALFIPFQGCPFHCIYCDQRQISGSEILTPQRAACEIRSAMDGRAEVPFDGDIAFFGGTFTGLPRAEMTAYLQAAYPYVKSGRVRGIRLSTRPDFIDEKILSLLQQYGVCHIELGVQSMDDEVLRLSGRGYTAQTVWESARKILSFGFSLGMQMMPGLPGDTPQKSMATAHAFAEMGAEEVRVYPTLVLRNTALARLYDAGNYQPMTLEAAVSLCAALKTFFVQQHITLLKMGLHSTLSPNSVVAGPYHPAFGQLVNSRLCLDKMMAFCLENRCANGILRVLPNQYDVSDIVGQRGQNRIALEKKQKLTLKIIKKPLTNDEKYIIL